MICLFSHFYEKIFGVHTLDHTTLMIGISTLKIFLFYFFIFFSFTPTSLDHDSGQLFSIFPKKCVHTLDHTTLMIGISPSFFLFFFKNFFVFTHWIIRHS